MSKKYLHYFETESEFDQERQGNYYEPWVSYTKSSERVDYNKPDYAKIPFTIEALGGGNITWKLGDKTVQYSKNDGAWETMNSATTISVIEGDEVQFKGTNQDYNCNTISTTSQFKVKGNIMSMTDGDNFEMADTVNANGFRGLFSGCTYLVSASDLKLPATTLATYCYSSMFNGCSSLTAVPEELPATTLASYCYSNMFNGCTSLATAPELPAMTLADSCYRGMFSGCTSFTTAPELPSTTLAVYCYQNMFEGCTSLTTAPELPATTLKTYCYCYMFKNCTNINYIKAMFKSTPGTNYTGNWVNGVSSTGTFVKNASASWTTTGVNGIPTGWTVETASS